MVTKTSFVTLRKKVSMKEEIKEATICYVLTEFQMNTPYHAHVLVSIKTNKQQTNKQKDKQV